MSKKLFQQHKGYQSRVPFPQDPSIRTPLSRKESFVMEHAATLPRGLRFGQIMSSPTDYYRTSSNYIERKSPSSTMTSFNEVLAPTVFRLEPVSIRNQEKWQAEERIPTETQWRDLRVDASMMHRTMQESTFSSRQLSIDQSRIKLENQELKYQLNAANKRCQELQQRNNLLEPKIQGSDLDIFKLNISQVSNPAGEIFSQSEKLFHSTKLLQHQKEEADHKRKNIEQVLLIQDQKMRDKEVLIKMLNEKLEEMTRQYQLLEKQLVNSNRKIEEVERTPKKISDQQQNVNLIQIISKKDKEINFLKIEMGMAKDLLSKKEDALKDKESSFALRLSQETRKLVEEISLKDKELTKERDNLLKLKGAQDQLIKKVKDETLGQMGLMENEFVLEKQNNSKLQVINDAMIKGLKDKILDLTLQLNKKEETFMRDKDQTMQQLVSYQSTIRTLQYEMQKATVREKTIQEGKEKLSQMLQQQEQINKKLREDCHSTKEHTEREANLLKDKETYQKLLISQETSIKLLKGELQSLKDQTAEIRKKAAREPQLLADKDALLSLITEKDITIHNLKAELANQEKQVNIKRQVIEQKQLRLKMLMAHEGTIKELREENSQLQRVASYQKQQNRNLGQEVFRLGLDLSKSKSSGGEKDKLILNQEAQAKLLREEIVKLNTLVSKLNQEASQTLAHARDHNIKLLQQRENEINKLKEDNRQLALKSIRCQELSVEREEHLKLLNSQQNHIQVLKEDIFKLNSQVFNTQAAFSEKDRELSRQTHKQKDLYLEKQGYQKLLAAKDESIKSLREEAIVLQRQIGRETILEQQKQNYQNMLEQLNQTILYQREEVGNNLNSLEALQRKSREDIEQIDKLFARISWLKEQIERSRQVSACLYQQNLEYLTKLNQISLDQESNAINSLNNSEQDNKIVKCQLHQLEIENDKIRQQVQELTVEKQQFQSTLKKLEEEYKNTSRDLEELKSKMVKKNHTSSTTTTKQCKKEEQIIEEASRQGQTIMSLQATIGSLQQELVNMGHLDKKCRQLEAMLYESNSLLIESNLGALNQRLEERLLIQS